MPTHDNLTGLPNRVFFHQYFTKSLKKAKTAERILYVLFIDLDGFKEINDTLGHDSGDIVLKTVAEILLKCVGTWGKVSRLGGDEFAIIIDKIDASEDINTFCNRIVSDIASPIDLGKNEVQVTASIGISIYPKDSDNMSELIKKADDAMYNAKKTEKK
jgi:diguanylate cyclase (GGDEF)-like protein